MKSDTGRRLINNCYSQILDVALDTGPENGLNNESYRRGLASMVNMIVESGVREAKKTCVINPDQGAYFESFDV